MSSNRQPEASDEQLTELKNGFIIDRPFEEIKSELKYGVREGKLYQVASESGASWLVLGDEEQASTSQLTAIVFVDDNHVLAWWLVGRKKRRGRKNALMRQMLPYVMAADLKKAGSMRSAVIQATENGSKTQVIPLGDA